MGPRNVEVIKFGGSSSSEIRQCAEVTKLHSEQEGVGVIVVTSAIAGVTEQLHDAERAALDPQRNYQEVLDAFAERHSRIIDQLSGSRERAQLHEYLGLERDKLDKLLGAARIKWESSPSTHDYVVSGGERIFSPIAGEHFREHGIDAVSVAAEDVIATDGTFGAANPDIPATRENMRRNVLPYLMKGKTVNLGGYYGGVRFGERVILNTLDRGGSDRSATAAAEAIHGDIPVNDIFLYKEVAGVMTADPRIVPEAQMNPHMIYDELKALSGVGGNVIHSRAVAHAQAINATLHMKNTFNPHDPGTRVDDEVLPDDLPIKAVTYLDSLPLIVVKGSAMDRSGITSSVTTAIAAAGWDIKFLSQAASEQIIYIALAPKKGIDLLQSDLVAKLAQLAGQGGIGSIDTDETAVVDVIGVEVDNPFSKELIYRGLQGGPDLPVNPRPGKESSGLYEMSILINNHDKQNAINAVRSIHRTIFG